VSEKKESAQSAVEAGRKQRGPSYSIRLLFVVLSALVSFAFCEVGLRLFWHNPYRYEVPERVLKLPIHHARSDYVVDRSTIDPERPKVRFRTDERSYILPSRQFETPDATVAFLGGSTTECAAVQENLRFPARVSYLLEKKGLKVNTLNAGRSGNTTHDSLNVLLNHLVEDKPDVVVLMEATNDIGVLSHSKSYQPRMGQVESFSQSVRFVLQKASSTFYFAGLFRRWATSVRLSPNANPLRYEEREEVQLPRDEYGQYEKRLRASIRISRAFSIEPVLMTQPLANIRNALTPDWADPRNQEVLNHIIRKVGVEEGAVVIDLVRHLIEDVEGWDQPMKIFYDGVHVNDRGSEVYAEYIAERLYAEVLARRIRG
jgi:lysophospholipase L1-like esterase